MLVSLSCCTVQSVWDVAEFSLAHVTQFVEVCHLECLFVRS